jgi:hypothetical protein
MVRRPPVRSWLPTVVIAPSGLLLALSHVALVTGRIDGWFWLERTVWRSGFDGGRATLTSLVAAFTGTAAQRGGALVVAAGACAAAALLLMALIRSRPPIEEAVYAVLATVLALGGVGYFHCKPRFLGVVVPLFLPPARWVSRLPLGALALLGATAVGLSALWSAWLVVSWPFSI